MLGLLHIENIAVIESADIEFRQGFNLLTGETGAGKSIIIDSISALMGERTSRDIIRTGEKSALVAGVFVDIGVGAATKISAMGHKLEDDGSLHISRQVHADGRNVCRINGKPAPLSSLRELGSLLIKTHGQHDSKALLDSSSHIVMLDDYAENAELLLEYTESLEKLKEIRKEQRSVLTDIGEKERNLEMLRFQINEIESSNLHAGEDKELEERRKMVRASENVVKHLSAALEMLRPENGDGTAVRLESAAHSMEMVADVAFGNVSSTANELRDLAFRAADCAEVISSKLSEFEFSEQELDEIESRLSHINMLKRKYGGDVDAVLAYLENARQQELTIETADEVAEKLAADYARQYEMTIELATALSKNRKSAAKAMADGVNNELEYLRMQGACFSVEFESRQRNGRMLLGKDGFDIVEFYIAPNLGEAGKPLAKSASGGELSRIMLAIHTISASDDADTLIFDEIDSGISGVAASKVAERLSGLAKKKQVLCVTHLAALAARADAHFLILKKTTAERTTTEVKGLDFEGRAHEIARINSGENITESTLDAARELLLSVKNI